MDTNYTIQYGDTLGALASKYGTDLNSLAKANNITDVNKITAGSVLKIPGQGSSSPTGAITSQSLAPVAPTTVPTYTPPTASSMPVAPTPVTQSIGEQPTSPLENQQYNLSKVISEATAKLTGQREELVNQQNLAGVNTLNKQLTDTNNEILAKQAELNKNDIQLISDMRAIEGKDTLLPFAQEGQAKLQGDAQIARALKSSEIGVLNARAIGLQGNIQLANKTAEDAVKLKYAPYQDMIDVAKAQLEVIKPFLDKEEQKQAEERQFLYSKKLKEIDSKIELDTYRAKKSIDNALSGSGQESLLSTPQRYTVTAGDTQNGIEAIAKQAGVSISSILKLNPSLKTNANGNYLIKEGQVIALPNVADTFKLNTIGMVGTRKLNGDQLTKFTASPIYKAIIDGDKYQKSLQAYKDAIEKYGTKENISADGKGALANAYQEVTANIKDYYNLGSLDNGVEKLIQLGIPAPDKLRLRDKFVISALNSALTGTSRNLESAKNQFKVSTYGDTVDLEQLLTNTMDLSSTNTLDSYLSQYGFKPISNSANSLLSNFDL